MTSIRYLLILILVPLLINQLSKNLLFDPLVKGWWINKPSEVFLNSSQEERGLAELKRFREKIRFEVLVGKTPELSTVAIEERLKDKVTQITYKYKIESAEAVGNIFADIVSVFTFIFLVVAGREQIAILKSFIDELIYGLSDSAKAFLIILLTDMFVVFHSTFGWEVILENTLRHFDLPENRNFIYLFISTVPVILDSVFKYWIFRYLNRILPSAVATYHNMNE
ncbi:hypothetical protein [Aerosakkonema funiforme]|uniref:hypothetical protein n=1 Tax=Aerosakkonema funiforme TaxID=1246630 RepID=UPI0035B858FD